MPKISNSENRHAMIVREILIFVITYMKPVQFAFSQQKLVYTSYNLPYHVEHNLQQMHPGKTVDANPFPC